MKYIKEYKGINFDDWDFEEEYPKEDDIKVGNLVLLKDKDKGSLRTVDSIILDGGYKRGDLDGNFTIYNKFYNYYQIVAEIVYKNGIKYIRFNAQWPYYRSSDWEKIKR
jgi:hypothetical protein